MTGDATDSLRREQKQIISGFQWTYLSVALQGVLKMVVLVVLARALTPRDFGLLSFALMCTSFVDRIGQIGVGQAIVQAPSVTRDSVETARILSTAFGLLTAGALATCSGICAGFFEEPELQTIVLALAMGSVFDGAASFHEALLQRAMRFRELMVAENAAYALGMGGCGIMLALSGYGVWSLVYATLALKVSRLGFLIFLGEPLRRGCWNSSDAAQLLRIGLGFSLGRVLNFFSLQGDNFVVGRLLGVEALGMYSRAYQLMTLPAMYVGQVFEKVMFPAMAKTQGNHAKLAREFLVTLEAITLVALPASAVMYFFAGEIVHVLFGPRWNAIVPVVSIISFGMFFRTAYKCSDTVVRSVGAVYHYAARQALYTIFVLTGAYVGSLYRGLEGVAFGVVAAVALNYLSMTLLCVRLVGVTWSSIGYAHLSGIWVTVILIAGLCLVTPSLHAVGFSTPVVLAIGSVISGVLWMVGLIIAGSLFPSGVLARLSRLILHIVSSVREAFRLACP